jgi:hypothetical protein
VDDSSGCKEGTAMGNLEHSAAAVSPPFRLVVTSRMLTGDVADGEARVAFPCNHDAGPATCRDSPFPAPVNYYDSRDLLVAVCFCVQACN